MKAFPTKQQGVLHYHGIVDGAPKFEEVSPPIEEYGMDLRDYFAAHAPEVPVHFPLKRWYEQVIDESIRDGQKWYSTKQVERKESWFEHQIRWRYEYADAMMKAREAK